MRSRLQLTAIKGLPLVQPGAELADLIADALAREGETLHDGDLLVIAQKIVSKAENRYVELDKIVPSTRALELAAVVEKDARLVELVLRESTEVLRYRKNVLVVRHRSGHVCANAGIDQSNVDMTDGRPRALLLPLDADASAAMFREALGNRYGVDVGIIVNDSAGRAWRLGLTGLALGTAGFLPLESHIGKPDMFGRPLEITEVAVADELAAAASFLMGQADEAVPVVLVRGARLAYSTGTAAKLIRPLDQDLFR